MTEDLDTTDVGMVRSQDVTPSVVDRTHSSRLA